MAAFQTFGRGCFSTFADIRWRYHGDVELSDFTQQINGLTQVVTGLSNLRKGDDHTFGAYQGLLISAIEQATEAGISRGTLLTTARGVVQLLVQLAERDDLTLSREIDALVDEYQAIGTPIVRLLTLSPSIPLTAFPKKAPVAHTIFVDEAGTASFTEKEQPVLSLVGVLVEDQRIDEFDIATTVLLERCGLPGTEEIHTKDVVTGKPPFDALEADERDSLLMKFLEVGLKHVVGVHYMSMLKPLVKPEFRRALTDRGLNAYTSNVLYFNAALKAAAFGRIGVAQYRYLFDRTDAYGADIKRILGALQQEANTGLRLYALDGEPTAVDSRDHRFIQLADVIAWFLVRYRQFEVRTFTPADALYKHEEKYRAAHSQIRAKVMDYVADGLHLFVDWKAVQEWSPPPQTQKIPRNAPCFCGSGKKFKKCHGK